MTLKQLQYAIAVADAGSITKAAKQLFIAQPSLTSAIHELEKEYQITLFIRSNRGIEPTSEGDEFLGYARQVLEQYNLLEARYAGKAPGKLRFSVSSQHYSFAVEAFVRLLKAHGGDQYEFHMRETQTYAIIEDVARRRSEIGILYLNRFNEAILRKTIRENQLTFTSLFRATPHVFVGRNSPLAKKDVLTLDDLVPYPRLSYEQGSHNAFYFSEEILSTMDCAKDIVVCDRATLFNMLIGLNGYTLCSGVISEELNGPDIIARPLDIDDYMEIGYILPVGMHPSRLTSAYIEELQALPPKF